MCTFLKSILVKQQCHYALTTGSIQNQIKVIPYHNAFSGMSISSHETFVDLYTFSHQTASSHIAMALDNVLMEEHY